MAGSSIPRRWYGWLCIPLLSLSSTVALAGSGFLQSSRVVGDESNASVEIRFNCQVGYVQHEPPQGGDRVRIFLEPTSICNGVSPLVATSKGRYRPVNAEIARLIDVVYDGDTPAGAVLTLNFSEPVSFSIDAKPVSFELSVNVRAEPAAALPAETEAPMVAHRQVPRPTVETPDFVINLASFDRVPTLADTPKLALAANQRVFYSEDTVDGQTRYRIRLGNFNTADEARAALGKLQTHYPDAWIDQVEAGEVSVDMTAAAAPVSTGDSTSLTKVDELMAEARQTMVAGDISRAIQLYTKVLQLPEHERLAEAQEYLALAREKNGQIAHAKAEYERFLSLYPNHEGATRVGQRLAALLAGRRQQHAANGSSAASADPRKRRQSSWRFQTFFSQYYRRDVNQQTDQDEVVSQSALYSDINFDARRRGERFDFSGRISAGYRNDFLDEGFSAGNQSRISYAYADLADAVTGLRGRVGRQSKNTGGVLGRFDGLNLGYQATERILVNAVIGKPAYSSNDGIDSERTFYGASVNYGPLLDGLDLGLFFIQQDIEGIVDRQAVGGEFRYFGENQSLWGLVDYDTKYQELGSAFLQASWRFGSRLTLHGSFDQRHSPFLSAGNAIIGQPVANFSELLTIFGETDVRQLGLDRSPLSMTYSVGMSHSLTPRLQINVDANETSVDASPDSGGIFGTPASDYSYYSTNIVASSLLKEGDVTIFGVRYSDSTTSKVISLTMDSRFPFGRNWRVNPRLRVDRRERASETDYEWIYTPGIRIQYRRNQKLRIELEAGRQYSQRDIVGVNIDRESYFINLGYQAFF